MWEEFSKRVGLSNEEVKVGWNVDKNLVKELRLEAVRRNTSVSALVQFLLLEAIDRKMREGEWG